MAAGVLAAIVSALAVANRRAGDSRQAFTDSAEQIATSLRLALQQQTDATASARAFVALNPRLSQPDLDRWVAAEQLHSLHPEIGSLALVELVLPAQLRGFERRAVAPVRPVGTGNWKVFPAGARPFYCLPAVGVGWGFLSTPPKVWVDACALPGVRQLTLGARDSGRASYVAAPYLGHNVLEVETPVYRGGTVPPTVSARRAAFIGVLGETILPQVTLSHALRGHPRTALEIDYHEGGYQAAFRYGRAPADAGRASFALSPGWTARIAGSVMHPDVFDDGATIAILIGGILFSATLGALLWVLASGRARARRLVAQKTSELEHLATHDPLTGLPNRVLALDRAEHALARAHRTGDTVVAMYLDIDGFKQINDSLGHRAGDAFLEQVAQRLQTVVREGDTAARLAGDEFLILLDGESHQGKPELVAERLLDVLREPFRLGGEPGRELTLSASIGIAQGQEISAEQLIADADFAMYAAKSEGKNRYVSFQSEMQTVVHDQLALQLDLFAAVAEEQLFLVYQPIFGLGSDEFTGIEALVRWRHPTRGVLAPNDFIPIAERTGQIAELGRWVLAQACTRCAQWRAEGHDLMISVNISGRQLDDDRLFDDVTQNLADTGLEPSALMLEITETALMNDPNAAAGRLAAIKALGVRLAIDDFGTGYSSLAYLRQFSVDALKIDRSFINAITSSPQAAAVTNTLIQLGKKLGIETLAEGIEEPSQLQYLRSQHCDLGQGFLLARPVERHELEALLHRRAGRSVPRL